MRWLAVFGWLSASVLAIALFHGLRSQAGLVALDLGEMMLPGPRYGYFLWLWTVCGSVAALLGAIGFAQAAVLLEGRLTLPSERSWVRRDGFWIAALAMLAFAIAVSVRILVLRDTRLTDDEPAYEFSSRLLASGRLYVPSPPRREFWARVFFINDGRWYPEYWLGWPAWMVPGVWLGAEGLVNPALAALAVPAVYLAARSIAGSTAARVATALLVTSPMLAVGNATKLSHTSCLCALAWMLWCYLRAREPRSRPAWSAAFALAFCAAFITRPHTSVMLGTPLLVAWLLKLRTRGPRWRAHLLAFAVPSLAMATLFLGANHVLTGSAFYPPFLQIVDIAAEPGYLFSQLVPGTRGLPDLRVDLVQGSLTLGIGLLRFNAELYGWPCSLVFALCALGGRRTGVSWAMVGSALFGLLFFWIPGIDTFGPTYYFELALPVSILSGIGCVRLRDGLQAHADALGRAASIVARLPFALVAALVLVTAAGYTPVRLSNVARIAAAVRAPEDIVRKHGIHNAILFGMRPFSPCLALPTRHFVYWPPANDAELTNDILWANHLTVATDRELLRTQFPTRKGYAYFWSPDCVLGLFDLDDPASDALPPNRELPSGWRLKP